MDYGNSNKTKPAGKSGSNTFHLTADMFPEGMAQTLKAGEVIEFKIVSPLDKDGDVEVEYNTGDEGEASQAQETMNDGQPEGEGTWDDEARKVLDPQGPENEAM